MQLELRTSIRIFIAVEYIHHFQTDKNNSSSKYTDKDGILNG